MSDNTVPPYSQTGSYFESPPTTMHHMLPNTDFLSAAADARPPKESTDIAMRVCRRAGRDGMHAVIKYAPATGDVRGYYRLPVAKVHALIAQLTATSVPYDLVEDESSMPACSTEELKQQPPLLGNAPQPSNAASYGNSGMWNAASPTLSGGAPVDQPAATQLPAMQDLQMSAETAFGAQQPDYGGC